MRIFAEELRRLGRPANPGDRLEYLIVEGKPDQLLGYRLRTPEIYLGRLNRDPPERIDYLYYLDHYMKNCIEQLFQTGYLKELEQIEQYRSDYAMEMVLQDLRNQELQSPVEYYTDQCVSLYRRDYEVIINLLLQSPWKDKVVMARRKYISGRNVFHVRKIAPITTIIKAIEKGLLQPVVQQMVSPEAYQRLFPLPVTE